MPTNLIYPEVWNNQIGSDIYIATGRFRLGTVTQFDGRAGENVTSIWTLPLDCDLRPFLNMEKDEFYALPDTEIENHLTSLREEVIRVWREMNLRPSRMSGSGYGVWLWFDIDQQDQHRVVELRELHRRLVDAFNHQAGYPLADEQVKDAGPRVARLPESWNTKGRGQGKEDRQSLTFDESGEVWTLDALRCRIDQVLPPEESPAPGEHATFCHARGTGPLSPEKERELIAILRPHWQDGHRHELALGLAGWFRKQGMPGDQAERIICTVAADDEELESRIRDVRDTYDKPFSDIAGWTWVNGTLPDSTMQRVGAILDALYAQNNPPKIIEIDGPFIGEAEPLPPAPDFPVHVLPPIMREYVESAAQGLGVPVEMVAGPMLGLTASLIGNRLHTHLHDGWREYLSLYLAIVAPPGSGKTPALDAAMWPFGILQDEAHETFGRQMAEYQRQKDAWSKESGEARPTPPALRNIHTTNYTIESLAPMHANSPGVAIVKDEISGWVNGMDAYKGGKGSEKQDFLSMWSSMNIKSDRVGRPSIYGKRPLVSVIGGIQPDLASLLRDEANRRDGFVERMLPMVPTLKPQRWTGGGVNSAQAGSMLGLIEQLDKLTYPEEVGDAGRKGHKGHAVSLSTAAMNLWVPWLNDNYATVFAVGGVRGGFYSKLNSHVARFALILHALHTPDEYAARKMIPGDRMADAIELGEWFRQHIHRFLPLLRAKHAPAHTDLPRTPMTVEDRVTQRLERKESESPDDDGWLSRSELIDGLRVSAGDLNAAFEVLLAAGKVEWRAVRKGRKLVEQWRLLSHDEEESPADISRGGGHSDHSDYSDQWGNSLNDLNDLNGGARENYAGQPMAS